MITDLDLPVLNAAGPGWAMQLTDAISTLKATMAARAHVSEFGVIGDDSAADGPLMQAACDAVIARGGGVLEADPDMTIRVPAGLNFDGATKGLIIDLGGTETAGLPTGGRLNYPAASGQLVSAKHGYGVGIRHGQVVYSNVAYADDLIVYNSEGVASGADSAFMSLDDLWIGGIGGAKSARRLVNLNQSIVATMRRVNFGPADVHVIGCDGSYSNIVVMDQCAHHSANAVPIKNAGESWAILSPTFEPRSDGKAAAYLDDSGGFSRSLLFQGVWAGDASVDGGIWFDLGTPLGCTFVAPRIAPAGPSAGPVIRASGGESLTLLGGVVEGQVDFAVAYVREFNAIGTRFTPTTPLIHRENSLGRIILGCTGLPNEISPGGDLGFGCNDPSFFVDVNGNLRIRTNGHVYFGGVAAGDSLASLYGLTGGIRTDQKLLALAGLGVGNYATASAPGTVVKKMEVFNAAGVSIGFVPIYDAIT